jgi:hypothetical protein
MIPVVHPEWKRDIHMEKIIALTAAGDRIVELISRCSDQAPDEQRVEHDRLAAAIKQIWDEAKK